MIIESCRERGQSTAESSEVRLKRSEEEMPRITSKFKPKKLYPLNPRDKRATENDKKGNFKEAQMAEPTKPITDKLLSPL